MIYNFGKLCLLTLTFLLFTLPAQAQQLEGIASFYGKGFDGKLTSTGETFRKNGFSAASKELPWGTIVEVTNLDNGRKTQVRINDCGPQVAGRIIDLSEAAGSAIGVTNRNGLARVSLRIILASTAGPTCNRSAWSKNLKAQGKPIPPPPSPWNPAETRALAAATSTGGSFTPPPTQPLEGMAGYYPDRLQGRTTSTGETYDRDGFTAASKIYPYGTVLEVTNVVTNRSVNVKVNDCGPISADRIIDLSYAAAARVGVLRAGVAAVQLRVIKMGTDGPTCNRSAWRNGQSEAGMTATLTPNQAPPPQPTVPGAPATYGGSSVAPPVGYTPPAADVVDAFAVQVGAFSKAINAQDLAAELVEKGYTSIGTEPSGNLTRVYVGAFAAKKDAKELETQLKKDGYKNASVKSIKIPAATPVMASKPVSTPAPAPAPAPATPKYSPTDILFGVQVGAFGTSSNAKKAVADLQQKGFTEVFSAKVGKSTRVFTGKFFFQHQAEELKEVVRQNGYPQASVRRVQ